MQCSGKTVSGYRGINIQNRYSTGAVFQKVTDPRIRSGTQLGSPCKASLSSPLIAFAATFEISSFKIRRSMAYAVMVGPSTAPTSLVELGSPGNGCSRIDGDVATTGTVGGGVDDRDGAVDFPNSDAKGFTNRDVAGVMVFAVEAGRGGRGGGTGARGARGISGRAGANAERAYVGYDKGGKGVRVVGSGGKEARAAARVAGFWRAVYALLDCGIVERNVRFLLMRE